MSHTINSLKGDIYKGLYRVLLQGSLGGILGGFGLPSSPVLLREVSIP